MSYDFIHSRRKILVPVKGSTWASEMVLNPSIIRGPDGQTGENGRIHLLFRATGPWPEQRLPGKPLPYPILLGYGWSDDEGQTWCFDRDRPALSPRLQYDPRNIWIVNERGETVPDHANGCIEDPRLFWFEGECWLTTACRMFPPGPYWDHDEPMQCAPEWAVAGDHPFGEAASRNVTVNVLFKVDLDRLSRGAYERAFTYVTSLTDPAFGEDRDVLFFPERLRIDGTPKIVMLHRPFRPSAYPGLGSWHRPSMVIAAADRFESFTGPGVTRSILAAPELPWERDRIGGSAIPLRIGAGRWLVSYHGKQDAVVGYTQSFMIVEERSTGFPVLTHRCPDRLITVREDWERPAKFATPCIFVTGLIRLGDRLLASYGAADETVGILEIDLPGLLRYLES